MTRWSIVGRVVALGAAAVVAGAASLQAHHSFAAEYDGNKPVTLTGTVTKIEWTNPHFYPDVLTKPWHQQETFRLRPNERLREYECIENNEDLLRFEKLLQTDPALKKPVP